MMVFRSTLIICLFTVTATAQSNRYIVFFKDKVGSPHTISQPSTFLSARSINRRQKSSVPVTADDLPVTPGYVTQVRATGAKAFFTTRWMNAALIEATPANVASVAALSFVSKVELVAPGQKLLGGRLSQSKGLQTTPAVEPAATQLKMHGLDLMHADGFRGEGVLVSVMDTGFPGVNVSTPFQHLLSGGHIKMAQDFVTNSGSVYQFDKHGTAVLSEIAGKTQTFTGGAYNADFLLFVTEDVFTEYRVEEYNWLFAAEKADSAGADIIQSSLGYFEFDDSQMDYKVADLNGQTAVVSKAAAMARDRGILVVVSAGNEGNQPWHYISFPADVADIISAGAITSTELVPDFSSWGPSADGRIKPDVAAMGVNVTVALPDGTFGTASGTSMASPLVASLAAGLIQAYPGKTPAELVHDIKASASQSNGPDNRKGYGIPSYTAVKNYIEAKQATNDVSLYPNPASTILNLAFKDLPNEAVEIEWYDSQGKVLRHPVAPLNWLNNPLEISISELAAGLYVLKVTTSKYGIRTFRFVKY
jgi:serine protease AprX